jgi:hypothetical protein
MPFEAPSQEVIEFANLVRSFIMDEPAFNFLNLNNIVLPDEKIYEAIESAVDDWNMTPPVTQKDFKAFKRPELTLIKKKAAIDLLYNLMFLHASNRVSYSDQGFNASEFNNYELFQNLRQELQQEYEAKKAALKKADSYSAALGGGVRSGYSYFYPRKKY